jgi:hypothetical protein
MPTRRNAMSFGKLAVIGIALVLAAGGVGAALADRGTSDAGEVIDLTAQDARKDDVMESLGLVDDDDGDGDNTRGDDGTSGGDNTGDGDNTRGDDGTNGGDNTGDGDNTRGDDGTSGGDNTGSGAGGGDDTGGDDTGGGGSDDGGTD